MLQVSEHTKKGTTLLAFEDALMPHSRAAWIKDTEAPYCMLPNCSSQFLPGAFQGVHGLASRASTLWPFWAGAHAINNYYCYCKKNSSCHTVVDPVTWWIQ